MFLGVYTTNLYHLIPIILYAIRLKGHKQGNDPPAMYTRRRPISSYNNNNFAFKCDLYARFTNQMREISTALYDNYHNHALNQFAKHYNVI